MRKLKKIAPATFRTLSSTSDILISDVLIVPGDTSASVTWKTNIPATDFKEIYALVNELFGVWRNYRLTLNLAFLRYHYEFDLSLVRALETDAASLKRVFTEVTMEYLLEEKTLILLKNQ